MRVFAIADPHLSKATPKPMSVFGPNWAGHPELFFEQWRETVADEDLVLVPGDISWAMRLEDALLDLQDVAALPGRKVLLRGNHDYWWPAIGKLRAALPPGMFALQNDALQVGGVVIAGTRGWTSPGAFDFTEQDRKIYDRELERLKLSLKAAKKLSGEKFVVMLHLPADQRAARALPPCQITFRSCTGRGRFRAHPRRKCRRGCARLGRQRRSFRRRRCARVPTQAGARAVNKGLQPLVRNAGSPPP